MTWKPGQSGNVMGSPKGARDALFKIRKALDKAIDDMRDPNNDKVMGVTRLAQKLTEALEKDPIRTLKSLSTLLPKDLAIDTTDHRVADSLSDEVLALIISKRAKEDKDKHPNRQYPNKAKLDS